MDMETDAMKGTRMDFHSVIMKMDNELHEEDIESIKFLCQGLVVSSKLKRVDTIPELVELLENARVVSKSDFFILADLLQYIRRIDILEAIDFDEREVFMHRRNSGSHINPFYVLLFQIAEDLSDEDVKKATFMYGKVPNSKKVSNGMDLFTIMCQHNAVSPENPRLLLSIFEKVERNDVVEHIRHYSVSQGESVLLDLEQQFVRSMQLRGQDVSGAFAPPVAALGKSSGPAPDDIDIPRGGSSRSTVPPSGFTSIASQPPSVSRMPDTSFNPVSNAQTSVQVIPFPGPLTSTSRPQVAPQPQAQNVGQNNVRNLTVGQDLLDSAVIPWKVLERLAQSIPKEYWPELCYQLGVHFVDTASNTQKDQVFVRNLALLKQWLELPETKNQDNVSVRMALVRALKRAGPELMAEKIAIELNIDIKIAVHVSMPASRQESAYDYNETASQASAAPESLNHMVNQSQPGDRGDIQVAPVTTQLQHLSLAGASPIPHYHMDRIPRGHCLIINNRDFYKDERNPAAKLMISREGTDVDRDKLKNTFLDLNFHVTCYDNLTDSQMLQVITRVSVQDHTAYDCFVCCILTHGVLGALYGINGVTVPIKDLTGPLRAQVCPTLAGKPKLFFMQACQGKEKQPGFDIQMDGVPEEDLQTDSPGQLIPNEADFLLGYATVPGFVSYRSKTRGSWYITKLTEMLRKYAFDHDILDILTLVNYEVGKGDANMEEGTFKQSPAPMYSLRKKLIFSPPPDLNGVNLSLRAVMEPQL